MMKTWVKTSVVLLLLIFFVLSLTSIKNKSITNDEAAHIPAGYSYWKTGDFRMNKEHPPLIKLISSVPLNFMKLEMAKDELWEQSREWLFGVNFLYTANQNPDQIIFWARVPMILLGMLFGFYVFKWSRELYGDRAGILALTLYAFSPNILAHTRLVTTDMGIAGFSLITLYYYWKFLEEHKRKYLYLTGLFLGLSLSAKFTGIYLFAIMGLILIARQYFKESGKIFNIRTYRSILSLAFICLIGTGVLIATYGIIGFPAYFDGFKNVAVHSTLGHRSYLMGEHSEDGWWYYFPAAFGMKTPIAMLMLTLLSLFYFSKTKSKNTNEIFLIVPIIFFLGSFMLNNINIGLRHILPIYPLLFIFVSKVINVDTVKPKVKYVLLGLVIVLYIVSNLLVYPHYLAFFNTIAGGPDNGWKYLIDSNIDWGQDLKGLGSYMEANDIKEIKLAYFGLGSKEHEHIIWDELKCGPSTGIMAVSVNRLVGFTQKENICLSWLREQEPIAKIGHSIFIYNITEEDIKGERESYCKLICIDKCEEEDLKYHTSSYNQTCKCKCTIGL